MSQLQMDELTALRAENAKLRKQLLLARIGMAVLSVMGFIGAIVAGNLSVR